LQCLPLEFNIWVSYATLKKHISIYIIHAQPWKWSEPVLFYLKLSMSWKNMCQHFKRCKSCGGHHVKGVKTWYNIHWIFFAPAGFKNWFTFNYLSVLRHTLLESKMVLSFKTHVYCFLTWSSSPKFGHLSSNINLKKVELPIFVEICLSNE
jgi:hypothetical protein